MRTWFVKLMETSGTDILNDSDVRAPVSPLHLAVSNVSYLIVLIMILSSISARLHKLIHLSGLPWAPPRYGGSGAVSAGFGCEKQPGAHTPGPGCLQGPCRVCGRLNQPRSLHPGQRLHLEAHPHPCCRYGPGVGGS